MKMDRLLLGKKIFHASYLKGQFKLRSGLVSKEYFDKYKFESDPLLLEEVGEHLSRLLPLKTKVLAGLEMGGIPLVTVLSLKTKLPMVFVRKEAKNYGTLKIAEGVNINDKNLCVVEDVITTGGQVITSVNELRKKGAFVENILCVILRGEKEKVNAIMKKEGLKLQALFTLDELKSK